MGVLVLVAAVGVLLDDRYLAGAPVWLKPLKFGVSFLVYALSPSWILGQLRPSRWVTGVGTVVAVSSPAELALITTQAARGRESHFNDHADPVDAMITRGMALMVVVLWTASLIIAVVALRRRFGNRATTWPCVSGRRFRCWAPLRGS